MYVIYEMIFSHINVGQIISNLMTKNFELIAKNLLFVLQGGDKSFSKLPSAIFQYILLS